MFWGAFLYDKKGPCHVWEDETKAEKLACKVELDRRNALRVDDDRASWQLKQDLEYSEYRRIHGRKKPGKQPQFRHSAGNGAYVREKGKGGIDWWRYQQVIMIPKLYPFVKECEVDRPGTIL
jgi:hypothetical protein